MKNINEKRISDFLIKLLEEKGPIPKKKKNHIVLESSENTPTLQKKIFQIIKKKLELNELK